MKMPCPRSAAPRGSRRAARRELTRDVGRRATVAADCSRRQRDDDAALRLLLPRRASRADRGSRRRTPHHRLVRAVAEPLRRGRRRRASRPSCPQDRRVAGHAAAAAGAADWRRYHAHLLQPLHARVGRARRAVRGSRARPARLRRVVHGGLGNLCARRLGRAARRVRAENIARPVVVCTQGGLAPVALEMWRLRRARRAGWTRRSLASRSSARRSGKWARRRRPRAAGSSARSGCSRSRASAASSTATCAGRTASASATSRANLFSEAAAVDDEGSRTASRARQTRSRHAVYSYLCGTLRRRVARRPSHLLRDLAVPAQVLRRRLGARRRRAPRGAEGAGADGELLRRRAQLAGGAALGGGARHREARRRISRRELLITD